MIHLKVNGRLYGIERIRDAAALLYLVTTCS